jgi:hypothetical protein
LAVWTDPVTRTPGVLVTGAIWNRDQENYRWLYDAVNRIYLPSMSFDTDDGSVTKAQVGTRGLHWKFPNDGSSRYVYATFPKPDWWVSGQLAARLYVSPDGTAGGNFQIQWRAFVVDPTSEELDTQSIIVSDDVTVAASSTQYRPTECEYAASGSGLVLSGDKIIGMRLGRWSGDGADTCTDAMVFSGLEMTYVPGT